MRPVERRRFRYLLLVGALLTAATVAADSVGSLAFLESELYDRRAQYCQFFLRPPAPPVHVDIDSKSLEEIGAWPWPRTRIAAVIDELYAAGAKVVALDILFSDPKPEEDEVLGQVLDARRTAVVAVNLNTGSRTDVDVTFSQRLRAELRGNLELSPEAARLALEQRGVRHADAEGDFVSLFVDERREAMFDRIRAALAAGSTDPDAIRGNVLPGVRLATASDRSPLVKLFDEQYDRALRVQEMDRFFRAPEPGLPPAFRGSNPAPLVLPMARAAGGVGFSNYDPDYDGAVRAVPLWLDVDGRLLPQLALATLCAAVGTTPHDVRITADSVIVPRKVGGGPDIVIPTHTRDFGRDKGVAHCVNVPMLGQRDWESMYDFPRHARTADHISILAAARIVGARERAERNEAVADRAILDTLAVTDPEVGENYGQLKPGVRPRKDMVAKASAEIAEKLDELRQIPNPPDELARQVRALQVARPALNEYLALDRELSALLTDQQRTLAEQVKGRTVFVGWIADGKVDFVTTAVHQRCPGVVVHGAIYSAAMSGELWRTVPAGYVPAITAALGLLTTVTVARLSPAKGFVAGLVALVAFVVVNGVLLFDYGDLIVGAAGPVTVIAVTWAGITLTRVGIEIAERTRITRRFQSYVDPRLVAYIVEHPELKRFEGEVREMTVGFTDLAGFTSLTEQLGPKTVGLLSRYMGRMVPVIRGHRGLVHRFMGDGIMFSYGAPDPNPDHAADAVATMLAMQAALARFNDEIVAEGYPPLAMRVGVCTGQVVVGDAGADAVDYTCLGDTTNSAARLESANKAVGTRNLLDARTLELLNDRYLVRPVGRLVVPGKRDGMMTFEPICPAADATDGQRRLVELTAAMVEHFQAARFEEAMAAAGQVDAEFGPSKLTDVYRELCRQHLADPPANFAGTIVVREK